EEGPTAAVLDRPAHPYTVGLLHSAPTGASHRARRLTSIPGSIPDLRTVERSAPFAGRCPVSGTGVCEQGKPGWSDAGPGHRVACHRFERDGREGTTWTR